MEDLIVRVLSGEASEADAERLRAWRRASPDNEATFVRLQQIWDSSRPPVRPAGRPISHPPGLDSIVAEAERRRATVVSIGDWRQRRVRRLRFAAVAAAAAVALLAVGRALGPRGASYSTGADEYRTVTLADGSVVRLAPDSRLRVSDDNARAVSLEGRAFFGVTSDPATPFTVETPSGRARVLGTRFELVSNADSLRLVVAEGLVALIAGGSRVEVAKGEMSRAIVGSAPTVPMPVDVYGALEWPNGVLIFTATPLREALEQVGRHFDVRVNIRDEARARQTVTAWFQAEPLVDVVATLCETVGARCAVGETVEVLP